MSGGLRRLVTLSIDVTNPGQFFACCGLLELGDRLWPGIHGCFERNVFVLLAPTETSQASATGVLDALAHCTLANTVHPEQMARLGALSAIKGAERAGRPELEAQPQSVEKLRREGPVVLQAPFHLRLDWFQDDRAGGSWLKTWAGRQSVLEIASSMKQAIEAPDWRAADPAEWFTKAVRGCGLPFNFDSDLGGQGSALDIGFSFDPLTASAATRIESCVRPCLELLAFIGLQRFRPRRSMRGNHYNYCTWKQPLPPELAAPAACGMLPVAAEQSFEFRLLYRTKYLKSFLPAIPYSGVAYE